MVFYPEMEIRQRPIDPAFFIHLVARSLRRTKASAFDLRTMENLCLKQTVAHVCIDRFFATDESRRERSQDMMDGMSLFDEWGKDFVHFPDFLFCDIDAGP